MTPFTTRERDQYICTNSEDRNRSRLQADWVVFPDRHSSQHPGVPGFFYGVFLDEGITFVGLEVRLPSSLPSRGVAKVSRTSKERRL